MLIALVGCAVIAIALFFPGLGLNSFFNEHLWLLPAVAFLLVLVILVEVQGFSSALHSDQIGACERGNGEKVGEVENLEHDRANLRDERDLVRALVPPGAQRQSFMDHVTIHIGQKSEAIGSKVASRTQYSEHPGGPPAAAVVIDCHAAYSGG